MRCVVVLPCLNEGDAIFQTCASLGFGEDQPAPEDAILVLVDNGSDDDTWAHMQALSAARPGVVFAFQEPVRGYIRARVAGAAAAARIADHHAWPHDLVLVLQADADTIYAPGYVAAMRGCAGRTPANRLYEGRSEAPNDPGDPIVKMQAAEQAADAAVADRFAPDERDIVVDDKVAAYRLSDYLAWGGHQQEFDNAGEEILAETTRLFMHARHHGAIRVRVDDAEARTSTRRILEAPDIAFATAGFPYPSAWKARWRARYNGPSDLAAFTQWPLPQSAREVLEERTRHVLALFVYAPELVRAGLASDSTLTTKPPGQILEDAFQLADRERDCRPKH